MDNTTENFVWKKLKNDRQTYTAAQAKRSEIPGQIPDEYRYVDYKCFMGNGKVHEVILPPGCIVIGNQAFESCQF